MLFGYVSQKECDQKVAQGIKEAVELRQKALLIAKSKEEARKAELAAGEVSLRMAEIEKQKAELELQRENTQKQLNEQRNAILKTEQENISLVARNAEIKRNEEIEKTQQKKELRLIEEAKARQLKPDPHISELKSQRSQTLKAALELRKQLQDDKLRLQAEEKKRDERELQKKQAIQQAEEETRKSEEIKKQRVEAELKKIEAECELLVVKRKEEAKKLKEEKKVRESGAKERICEENRLRAIQSSQYAQIKERLDKILRSRSSSEDIKVAILEFNNSCFKGKDQVILGLLDLISGMTKRNFDDIRKSNTSQAGVEKQLHEILRVNKFNEDKVVRKAVYTVLNTIYWDTGSFVEAKIMEVLVLAPINHEIIKLIRLNDKSLKNDITSQMNHFEALSKYNRTGSEVEMVYQLIQYFAELPKDFPDMPSLYNWEDEPVSHSQTRREQKDHNIRCKTQFNNDALTHHFEQIDDSYEVRSSLSFMDPSIIRECLMACFRILADNSPKQKHKMILETLKTKYLVRKKARNKFFHKCPRVREVLVECIEKIGRDEDIGYLEKFDNLWKEENENVVNAVLKAIRTLQSRDGLSEHSVIITPATIALNVQGA